MTVGPKQKSLILTATPVRSVSGRPHPPPPLARAGRTPNTGATATTSRPARRIVRVIDDRRTHRLPSTARPIDRPGALHGRRHWPAIGSRRPAPGLRTAPAGVI